MIKRYLEDFNYDKVYRDRNNNEWGYFSKRRFKKLYITNKKDSIIVIGEVLKGKRQNKKKTNSYIGFDDKKLELNRIGTYKKGINKISGYMKCENDEYIVVLSKNWLLFFIIFLGIAIAMFGVIYFKNLDKGIGLDPNSSKYHVDIKKPEGWNPSKISIPGYGTIQAKVGSKNVDVALWNPDFNSVYFEFNVILTKTNESLYKTGLIAPGEAVTKIPLKSNMKAGIYDITIKIKTFDLKNPKQSMNGADVNTKLILLK